MNDMISGSVGRAVTDLFVKSASTSKKGIDNSFSFEQAFQKETKNAEPIFSPIQQKQYDAPQPQREPALSRDDRNSYVRDEPVKRDDLDTRYARDDQYRKDKESVNKKVKEEPRNTKEEVEKESSNSDSVKNDEKVEEKVESESPDQETSKKSNEKESDEAATDEKELDDTVADEKSEDVGESESSDDTTSSVKDSEAKNDAAHEALDKENESIELKSDTLEEESKNSDSKPVDEEKNTKDTKVVLDDVIKIDDTDKKVETEQAKPDENDESTDKAVKPALDDEVIAKNPVSKEDVIKDEIVSKTPGSKEDVIDVEKETKPELKVDVPKVDTEPVVENSEVAFKETTQVEVASDVEKSDEASLKDIPDSKQVKPDTEFVAGSGEGEEEADTEAQEEQPDNLNQTKQTDEKVVVKAAEKAPEVNVEVKDSESLKSVEKQQDVKVPEVNDKEQVTVELDKDVEIASKDDAPQKQVIPENNVKQTLRTTSKDTSDVDDAVQSEDREEKTVVNEKAVKVAVAQTEKKAPSLRTRAQDTEDLQARLERESGVKIDKLSFEQDKTGQDGSKNSEQNSKDLLKYLDRRAQVGLRQKSFDAQTEQTEQPAPATTGKSVGDVARTFIRNTISKFKPNSQSSQPGQGQDSSLSFGNQTKQPSQINQMTAKAPTAAAGFNNFKNLSLVQDIMNNMKTLIQGSNMDPKARLNLDFSTQAFGQMKMSMLQKEGGVQVSIEVGSDSARQQLMKQRDEIAEQMKQFGYKDVSVDISYSDQQRQQEQQENQQASGNENIENVKLAGDDQMDLEALLG